jgi:hypothetical protein
MDFVLAHHLIHGTQQPKHVRIDLRVKIKTKKSNKLNIPLGTLLTYNQACTATNQCYTSLGLSCTNQLCQCDIYHSWSSVNNICKFWI